ncbi:MAG: hypothetical protein JNM99_12275 [Verrucomicrobiaceae bacterium]|nr:hypothetical protein [Verrucomicrobiaceae bacterium]
MTALLQQVIAKAEALPEETQNALASDWLEALESERKWDDLFANSREQLAQMAREALAEHRAGNTKPMESLRELDD